VTHIPSYIRSKRAAYKALAPYRISAAERDTIAQKISDTIAEVPRSDLPLVIEAGLYGGVAAGIAWMIPSHVPTGRRREAAGAAVVAAARAILDPP
jgi:hypothetical protein